MKKTHCDWERQSHEENTELRLRETKRHRRRNHELELEYYVISMIAELRFVFGENETMRDLRESLWYMRDWARVLLFFFNIFLNFFSKVENFRVFLLGVVNLRGFTF